MVLVPGYFAAPGQRKSHLRVTRIYVSQKETCYNGTAYPHPQATPRRVCISSNTPTTHPRPQKLGDPETPRALPIHTVSLRLIDRRSLPTRSHGHPPLLHRPPPALQLPPRPPLLHQHITLPRSRHASDPTASSRERGTGRGGARGDEPVAQDAALASYEIGEGHVGAAEAGAGA